MKSVDMYMQELNFELQQIRIYKTLPFNPNRHGCTEIAKTLAQLIVNEGECPDIIRIGKNDMSDKIKPFLYPQMTPWYYHDVCRLNGDVYDPNLGKPCAMNKYMLTLFNEKFRFYHHEILNKEILKLVEQRDICELSVINH